MSVGSIPDRARDAGGHPQDSQWLNPRDTGDNRNPGRERMLDGPSMRRRDLPRSHACWEPPPNGAAFRRPGPSWSAQPEKSVQPI